MASSSPLSQDLQRHQVFAHIVGHDDCNNNLISMNINDLLKDIYEDPCQASGRLLVGGGGKAMDESWKEIMDGVYSCQASGRLLVGGSDIYNDPCQASGRLLVGGSGDPKMTLEDSCQIGALKELVEEGKTKYVGLLEASSTISRIFQWAVGKPSSTYQVDVNGEGEAGIVRERERETILTKVDRVDDLQRALIETMRDLQKKSICSSIHMHNGESRSSDLFSLLADSNIRSSIDRKGCQGLIGKVV
ncbi:hypothetical protein L1887_06051 [Cichorium endivia]|nr:hypothetical protein L1887_06051 [Cichorium endivia]